MIEVIRSTTLHGQWLVDAEAMRVARLEYIIAVVLQENVFVVIDVATRKTIAGLFNPTPQSIVPICRSREWSNGSGGKLFYLDQPVLGIVCINDIIPVRLERLSL